MNHDKTFADPAAGIRFRKLKRDRLSRVILDRMLPTDHTVRSIEGFVATLDFSALLGRIKARDGEPGAAAIDPRVLFALWLYGSIEGVGSARQLAKVCRRDLAFLWLSGQTAPNYHTLADFYSDNEEFLRSAFAEHIEVLLEHGLIQLKEVTLDGRKIPANAGKESFHREPTLNRHRQEAEEQLAKLAAQRASGGSETKRREAAQRRAALEKKGRLEAAAAKVKQRQEERAANHRKDRSSPADARASETDADARKMKMSNGGFTPAFNTQTVMDTEHSLIVTVRVTEQASDNGLLKPLVEQVRDETGRLPERVLADAGYADQKDVEELEMAGVKVYMPPKNERKELKDGKDPYAKKRDDTLPVVIWRARMGTAEARTIYRRRAPVAEGVHAQQSNRGWRRYRLRGLAKAGIEALWQALAHNVRALIARNRLPGFAMRAAEG
jgi:transposase